VDFLGDMTVGKTAICHVAGNDATAFPKTYNCVSLLSKILKN
jgi:hypothetical protein